MAYRKFSRKDYERYDRPAKEVVVNYLNSLGIYACAEENFDADVKALVPAYYEAEIKAGWEGAWPKSFKTVDIPARKKKLLDKHSPERLTFVVIAGDLKRAWLVPGTEMTEDRIHKKDNRYAKGESFYMIPLKYCTLIKLEG